jgi:O-antigen/teichoic acid export membrane protein
MAVGRGATMLIAFALVPFVIRCVGKEAYGLYVLVTTITGYFTLLDFGVSAAVLKYVAEYRGRGELPSVYRIINSALGYHLLIGMVVALALLGLSPFADTLFDLDAATRPEAQRLFLVGAVAALVLWPTNLFRTVTEAFQRFVASAIVSAVCQAVAAAAAATVLLLGLGITAVLAVLSLGALTANLIFYGLFRREQPDFRVAVTLRDLPTMRLMFRFSVYMFLGGLASMVIFQLDNLVVGTFVSVSAVAVYNIAYLLHTGVKTVDNLINGPPWVASAEMEGQDDHAGQRRLFLRGTRYVACLMLPGIVTLILFARSLITSWMGPGFEDSVLPARILLAGWLVVSLWEPGAGVVTARGLVRPLTAIAFVQAGLNLALSLILVQTVGVSGVALGTTIPFIMVAPLMWRIILRTVDVPVSQLVATALARGVAPQATVVLAGGVIVWFFAPATLLTTVAGVVVVYALGAAVGYVWGLDAADRSAVMSLVQGPRRAPVAS